MSHSTRKTAITVGPQDNGRRMSLEDFHVAQAQEGYNYELSRGVVVVIDIPNYQHLAQMMAVNRQVYAYDLQHPGKIDTIASGSECKLLIVDLQSGRTP